MNLHEYQAKAVLRQFGIPVPEGVPVLSLQDLPTLFSKLPPAPWVVKAQVPTGGRGKAGGILKAASRQELETAVKSLFGKRLVTAQTGAAGLVVRKVYVEQAQPPCQELYMACVMDRTKAKPLLMASGQGGVEIEELARTHPESIVYEDVDPFTGLDIRQARSMTERLQLTGPALEAVSAAAQGIVQAFIGYDASLIEINPLGLTAEGRAIAMDAKISLDDNGLFRHPDAQAWRDPSEENPLEVRASQAGVNYVAMDGTIGCLVNGAGLAMATMDLIKYHGGEPADFLDVGGGANTQQVAEAFRILLSDPKVKAVLVNIFGGIMKCDVIATAIVAATREVSFQVPLVVRLEGTHVNEGRQILHESGLRLMTAKDLTEAAEKVVAAAKSG